MIKKPQIFGTLFVIAVFALIATGIKSPVTGASFEKLTVKEATARWETSGHADETSEAFRHWDEDDPAVVSTDCARCHSTDGFVEFIGSGEVATEYPAADDVGIECTVCHTDDQGSSLRNVTSVTFPSGDVIEDLGNEAICMQCHQGRESTIRIESDIAAAKAAATGTFTDDTVSSKLRFRNVHYAQAGAVNMGTLAQSGAEYPDKYYDARFAHVDGYNACSTCHDPHTLKIRLDNCSTCHTDPGNTSYWGGIADPKNIRYFASWLTDYDGDGNTTEGIYYEIDTLKHTLWDKIAEYATDVLGKAIVHGDGYPYFFIDTNGNGVADESEQERSNAYDQWTVRLARAVYNYQYASKDHGGYAHGGKYIIQLIYDSIEDLNVGLREPAAHAPATEDLNRGHSLLIRPRSPMSAANGTSNLHREDEGHFNGGSDAWRHWDEDGEVSTSCVRCHSATGLAYYLETGLNQEGAHIANGMLCTTCHTSPPALLTAGPVTFPSGAVLDLGDSSNLCMNCHQGRESMNSIVNKLKGKAPYSFTNIHYYPVGAILFGTEAKGAYEFAGKSYAGRKYWPNHMGQFDTCVQCHMGSDSSRQKASNDFTDHNVLTPNPADCVYCHGQDVAQSHPGADPAYFEFSGIRPGTTPDYDGDGNKSESIEDEIKGLEDTLYAMIQSYASSVLGKNVAYDSHSYPYFFVDKNGNGVVDPDEASRSNGFTTFDATLLPAAYNFQASKKEPHGFIHNSRYVAQFLVDSLGSLGGDTSIYTWR